MSQRSQILAAAFGISAFILGTLAYFLGTNQNLLVPFDIAALCWLVYDTNIPRLIIGYSLPRVTAFPFIIGATCAYSALLIGRPELTYPVLAAILICFFFALALINKSIEPERLHGSLKKRLEAAEKKNLLLDADYPRKRAILFWGLITMQEKQMVILGDVLLLPVVTAFFGLVLIVYLLSLASTLGPLLLIETAAIVVLNLLRLGKMRIRRLLHGGPLRFLVETWSATDRVEEGFSKRIIRVLRRPHGLLYFWGLVASCIFALVAVYVFGTFVTITASMALGMRTPDLALLISILILLNVGYLPAFLFPAFLSISMIRFTYDRGAPKLPKYPLLWLAYSIIMLSFFILLPNTNQLGLKGSFFIVGPAFFGTLLIVSALLQKPVPLRKRDEFKFAVGIILVVSFFVLQSGGDRLLMGSGIAITILLWYGIGQIMSDPLAQPFTIKQKIGVVSLSLAFAFTGALFWSHNDRAPALLAGFGSILVWIYLLPKEKANKLGNTIFGIKEEISVRQTPQQK